MHRVAVRVRPHLLTDMTMTTKQEEKSSLYPISERLAFLREHLADALWHDETKKADYIKAEIECLERKVREGAIYEPRF